MPRMHLARLRPIASLPRRLPPWAPALLGLIGVVALLHLELLAHLATHVIGRSFDDAFEVLWQLGWMERVVFAGAGPPWTTPDIFYPTGWAIASSAQPPWYMLLLAPFTRGLGATATYNLLHLGILVGAGFGVYLLVADMSGDRRAAFLAGVAYLAAPNLRIRLGGQTSVLLAALFLPYAYLFAYQAMRARGLALRRLALAGVALAATILGQWYFLYIAPLPMLAFLFWRPDDGPGLRGRVTRLAAIGGLALLLVAPFALLTWRAQAQMLGGPVATPLVGVDSTGLSPDRLFLPYALHPLYGEAVLARVAHWRAFVDGQSSLGLVVIALALVGLWRGPRRAVRLVAGIGLIALVLALGTSLTWGGERVLLPAGPGLAALNRWLLPGLDLPGGRAALPLPGALLYHLLPFYASIRMSVRFLVVLAWAAAALAGLGAAAWLARARHSRAIFALVFLALVADGWMMPYPDLTPVAANDRPALHAWLSAQPDPSPLIEYPIEDSRAVSKVAMYNQPAHGQPLVNGYMSLVPIYQAEAAARLGAPWPNAATPGLLREWGVAFVVINGQRGPEFAAAVLDGVRAIPGLCPAGQFDEGMAWFTATYIFRVMPDDAPCPPGALPSATP